LPPNFPSVILKAGLAVFFVVDFVVDWRSQLDELTG